MEHLRIKKWGIISFIVVATVAIQGCSHYDDIMKNGKESAADGSSHNAGRNCMECHHDASNEASEENRWWYFAGTVFDQGTPAASAGHIELWTRPGRSGKLLYKVPVDRSGNFYTAKIFSFEGGFYPVFVSNTGALKEMTTKTAEGACNSCHGVSEPRITIN